MTPNIRTIRNGVLAAAGLVLGIAAAFLIVAWVTGRRFHFDLPNHLGVDISQTANGFTYSQSSKGHTLFTIHASKLIEYKADQARLHDVSITLYGPEGSNRVDKISGSDFLYDRKQGVATAEGAVEIEMASPTTPAPGASAGAGSRQPIHIHTSRMSFNQNTSEATTDAPVEFTLINAAGQAVGASYNSKTGVLMMNAQVVLTSQRDQGTATVRAASAEFVRDSHMAFLRQASSEYATEKSSSDAATLHFRPDGTVEQLEAQGHVHVVMQDGSDLRTGKANVQMDPMSQPVKADLFEGVNYVANSVDAGKGGNAQSMHGNSVEGTLDFAGKGKLHHAQFRNAVSFVEQVQSRPGERYSSSTREVRGSQVDVAFAPDAAGRSIAQTSLAVGDSRVPATVVLHDMTTASAGAAKVTTITGNRLLATLEDGHAVRQLDGEGHTKIVDATPDGASSTSTGDVLHVKFVVTAKGSPRPQGDQAIESAVQQGNVTMLQQPARDAKGRDGQPQAPLHATARQAQFGGADQMLHLTGDPHVTNGSLDLTADLVDYHRDTGDASARGNVKSTYVQTQPAGTQQQKAPPTLGGEGPVHIIADHADLRRSDDLSVFYGASGVPARMWQGVDSVAAPVLELSKPDQTLFAHGTGTKSAPAVHATLAQRSDGKDKGPQVARVQSDTLHYYDKAAAGADKAAAGGNKAAAGADNDTPAAAPGGLPWRRADFHGSVVAEEATGIVHADDAHAYLTPDQPGKPSELDHLVAVGHVVITQPGRRGVGERLLYTAADTRYVLTGTPNALPRVTDAEKGTTTGAALIFTSANDSVVVSSEAANQKQARTVTDTRSPR